ncbi:MAG: chloride channel protein [Phycisphaerae bacterium]|nr:chloride channel protein [Phycisphaerae bacterium]
MDQSDKQDVPKPPPHIRLSEWLGFQSHREEWSLVATGCLTGVATGFFAHVFYRLIEWLTGLCYGGHHGEGPGWFGELGLYGGHMALLVVLPAVGALLVGLITYFFASEAKGHGVPEVLDALHRGGGRIRPRVAGAKAIASSLTIGSGGSAGTEGPIIQIGAALGSTFGQLLKAPPRQMTVLVASGAAGGIAAIFNAPIAGVLFAQEIFLRDFSFRAFSPVVLASVLSSTVTRALRPEADRAIFAIPIPMQEQYHFTWTHLGDYAVLGLLCAVAAVAFVRLLYLCEDFFDWLKIPAYLKPVLGVFVMGVLAVIALNVAGPGTMMLDDRPAMYGNGYAFIRDVIAPGNPAAGHLPHVMAYGFGALGVLFFLKLAATSLTLGSGGSGGVFAPALFLGAVTGGLFGQALFHFGWISEAAVPTYPLVGMAAVVGASTHAPLTAILIIFELTNDYRVILPVMLAVVGATGIARLLLRDSIYTLKLRRRGVRFGTTMDLTVLRRIVAQEVTPGKVPIVRPDDPFQNIVEELEQHGPVDFVVADGDGKYLGILTTDAIQTALLEREAVPLLVVEEVMRPDIPDVSPDEPLDSVFDKFAAYDVTALAMTDRQDGKVKGTITRTAVMSAYLQALVE